MKKTEIRLLVVILLLGSILLILVRYELPILAFGFIDHIRDWLSAKLYISKHFITALSFVLALGAAYVGKDLFSWNKKRQKRGLFVFFGFMVCFYIFLGVVENKRKFDVIHRIVPTADTRFFVNGNPVLWYHMRSNGKLEIYDHGGLHPQFQNVKLLPISDSVAKLIKKYTENKQDSMFIGNTHYKNGKLYEFGDGIDGMKEFL